MRLKREIREKKALEKRLQDLENEALLKQKQYKEKFGGEGNAASKEAAAPVKPAKQKPKALTKRGNQPASLLGP